MSLTDELEKLSGLKQSGAVSEEEYQQAKEALLAQHRSQPPAPVLDVETWGVFIHLSQFLTYLIPLAGIIAPIILWQLKKDESKAIDLHGKIVLNWILTELLLFFLCGMLIFIVIGIPLFFVVGAMGIIFPVIGAIKAGNGQIWPYPCSIRFFK